jgi:hypothetical protein
MNTDQIRRRLRNIDTRAATMDALAEQGAAAIDGLLPLLQDRHEGVRWSAIKILSEIGDDRTIGPLIALLEQSKNVTDAANALRLITGQEFGEEAGDWRRWAVQDPAVRNAAGGHILPDAELIEAATRDLPAVLHGEGQEYSVTVRLPEGRSQTVWVDLSRKDPNGRPIVQLSTPCGDVDRDQYETALKLNMTIPYGAIAIALLDGTHCFAMVDSYLRETVHPEDIAESIMSLARHGDSVEKSLSGGDRF